MNVSERFLKYLKFNTEAVNGGYEIPSSNGLEDAEERTGFFDYFMELSLGINVSADGVAEVNRGNS